MRSRIPGRSQILLVSLSLFFIVLATLGILFSVSRKGATLEVADQSIFVASSVFLFGALFLFITVLGQLEERKFLETLPTTKELKDFTREYYKIFTSLQGTSKFVEPLEQSCRSISNDLLRLESSLAQSLQREKIRESQLSNQLVNSILNSLEYLGRVEGRNYPDSPEGRAKSSCYREMNKVLSEEFKKVGISVIRPNPGDAFSEDLHQWSGAEPSKDIPEGMILACSKQGYQMNGEILTKAIVSLSAG